ncbi:ficolin-2-like [Lucilia sericata]|uniref:ficolin-2-like n=1 Tax=Lucilia sericata TaxID=13632 RepID=UPI0018A821DC|nr:ficolin-2-like [Lucilia sericata]XP_037810839.1 ficolin-2-like [Lucilia sericata]
MLLYLLLLSLNILFVNSIENYLEDDCNQDSELLTQLMQYINKNQNLSLHVLSMSERLNKLELQLLKYETKETTTSNEQNCVDAKDSAWIVIQRRMDGSVDFFRTWNEYKEGFGNKSGEFFIGLETLHQLTDSGTPYELLITMETFKGIKRHANYSHFIVGGEPEYYKLKNLGRYHGDAGDSLNYHLHQWFSTKDRKNDQNPYEDCAKSYEGGWWYNECHLSNLNGRYHKTENTQKPNGIHWYKVTDYTTSLKFVEMKIRPRICSR